MSRHASHGLLSPTFMFLFILEPTVPCNKSVVFLFFFNATDNGMKTNKQYMLSGFTLVQLMPLKCPTKNSPVPCIQTQLPLAYLFSVDLIIIFHMNQFLQGLFTFVRLELCNSHPLCHTHEQHICPSQVCCFKANIVVISRAWKATEEQKSIPTAVVKRKTLSRAVKAKGAYYQRPLLSSQQQWHPV